MKNNKREETENLQYMTLEKKEMENLIEKIQQEAFMEGFHYAIEILESCIIDKEKTK